MVWFSQLVIEAVCVVVYKFISVFEIPSFQGLFESVMAIFLSHTVVDVDSVLLGHSIVRFIKDHGPEVISSFCDE